MCIAAQTVNESAQLLKWELVRPDSKGITACVTPLNFQFITKVKGTESSLTDINFS